MKLFDILKKRDGEGTSGKKRKANDIKELEIYSGMRVVVETIEGQLLFIANLQDPHGGMAKLHQYSDAEIFQDAEVVHEAQHMYVKLRGYNNLKRKAVFMEGVITPGQKHIWQIEKLTVTKVENERAFYRLNTDIEATVTTPEGDDAGERKCRLLNISVGGASISSEHRYHKEDRFLLKGKLFGDESTVVLYCEVLRVTEKSGSRFEYGCQFLELAEANQEQIARSILAARNKERKDM